MYFNPLKKNQMAEMLPKVRGKYLYNVPMKRHTKLCVGGDAEVVFCPEDIADLQDFLRQKPENIPMFVLGGGSNVLVRDGGIAGVVVSLTSSKFFRKYEVENNLLTCYAGLHNEKLLRIMCDSYLGGLEFLASIPGTIGGAVRTNAGCFGYCIGDFLQSAMIVDSTGELKKVYPEDLNLGYRSSLFPDDWIVVSLTFKLRPSTKHEIKNKIKEYQEYRLEKQPYNKRTAGSFFKNPDGLKAWELIKKSGAQNLKVGGAEVSDKHCNFIINSGNATAEDIEKLAEEIVNLVKRKTYITLEWEVKRVGVKK